jgi:hypothetical protein
VDEGLGVRGRTAAVMALRWRRGRASRGQRVRARGQGGLELPPFIGARGEGEEALGRWGSRLSGQGRRSRRAARGGRELASESGGRNLATRGGQARAGQGAWRVGEPRSVAGRDAGLGAAWCSSITGHRAGGLYRCRAQNRGEGRERRKRETVTINLNFFSQSFI